MSAIPWHQVLAAAQAAAPHLPPPANVVASIALALAQGLVDMGCSVEGCDVELLPPRAPDLLGLASRNRVELDRIATGTDRASIERLRGDSDEVLVARPSTEHPDAEEVYGRG